MKHPRNLGNWRAPSIHYAECPHRFSSLLNVMEYLGKGRGSRVIEGKSPYFSEKVLIEKHFMGVESG